MIDVCNATLSMTDTAEFYDIDVAGTVTQIKPNNQALVDALMTTADTIRMSVYYYDEFHNVGARAAETLGTLTGLADGSLEIRGSGNREYWGSDPVEDLGRFYLYPESRSVTINGTTMVYDSQIVQEGVDINGHIVEKHQVYFVRGKTLNFWKYEN